MRAKMSETTTAPGSTSQSPQEYKLEAENELRFEVEGEGDVKVTLILVEGQAEIFGTELMKGHAYTFYNGAKVAVFTWTGATVTLSDGTPAVAYIAFETPMVFYSNIHGILEQFRQRARDEDQPMKGPTCMVCGPTDVGKTTLTRILTNYAIRKGWTPIYVDLDVGQGSVNLPGTIGAVVCEKPSNPEDNSWSLVAPLALHFGHLGPANNGVLYNKVIERLSQIIKLKRETDKKAAMSGVFINTCGWIESHGYKAILAAARAFQVDIILCIDQERLYNELVRDLGASTKVILTPKSGGVVERSRQFRIDARQQRIREYFYGPSKNLYPHSFDVPFSSIKLYKIGAPNLPDSCLPIGMKAEDNQTKVVTVQPSMQILNHLLSVSFAQSAEDSIKVIESNLLGYVCVTGVDTTRQLITLLSPQPRPLPSNSILLLSDVQFMDSH